MASRVRCSLLLRLGDLGLRLRTAVTRLVTH